jgi:hypothetical protein
MVEGRGARCTTGQVAPEFRIFEKRILRVGAKILRGTGCGTFGSRRRPEASSILVAFMSDLFGVTPLGQHGGKRPGAGRPRKGEVRPQRTGAALNSRRSRYGYILARLARDAQEGSPEAATLLRGVHDGLISAYAAAVEMNYCRRCEPLGTGSENATKRNDWAMHRLFNPRPPKVPTG